MNDDDRKIARLLMQAIDAELGDRLVAPPMNERALQGRVRLRGRRAVWLIALRVVATELVARTSGRTPPA
jgi:hypothetical protein